jgi:hypothetical protein
MAMVMAKDCLMVMEIVMGIVIAMVIQNRIVIVLDWSIYYGAPLLIEEGAVVDGLHLQKRGSIVIEGEVIVQPTDEPLELNTDRASRVPLREREVPVPIKIHQDLQHLLPLLLEEVVEEEERKIMLEGEERVEVIGIVQVLG